MTFEYFDIHYWEDYREGKQYYIPDYRMERLVSEAAQQEQHIDKLEKELEKKKDIPLDRIEKAVLKNKCDKLERKLEELGWQYEELMKRRKQVRNLEKKLELAMEAVEFYGDTNSWFGFEPDLTTEDWYELKEPYLRWVGGKLAREIKQKIKEIDDEIKVNKKKKQNAQQSI